ncbi:hypothetical protein WA845_02950 [Agrobacterium sp. CMT1]|uniref:hypothetical protein n=1 Tax=Agrobacterium sp. CMT1 TaxID=3128901 RepID=UPI0030775E77
MTIDPNRLTVLRTACAREDAALEHARAALHADMDVANEFRRQILAEQRRVKPDRTDARGLIEELQEKQAELNKRIEDKEGEIEILQERAHAAKKLRKTCEAYAAAHAQQTGDAR